MRYIEAPSNTYGVPSPRIFLAGGITNCPDWQAEMVGMLSDTNLTLFNPRRKNFPIHIKSAALNQIRWEHQQLRKADAILFWFPHETLCPIVLYELGAWSVTEKPLFIGVHPEYARKQDVEIQTQLVRRGIVIVGSLSELAGQVVAWVEGTGAE